LVLLLILVGVTVEVCLSLKDEGYEADDIENEAAIIRVQLAYLYYMQQRPEVAKQLLLSVLEKRYRTIALLLNSTPLPLLTRSLLGCA
jgi:Tfp pilus assembly protein PilF